MMGAGSRQANDLPNQPKVKPSAAGDTPGASSVFNKKLTNKIHLFWTVKITRNCEPAKAGSPDTYTVSSVHSTQKSIGKSITFPYFVTNFRSLWERSITIFVPMDFASITVSKKNITVWLQIPRGEHAWTHLLINYLIRQDTLIRDDNTSRYWYSIRQIIINWWISAREIQH